MSGKGESRAGWAFLNAVEELEKRTDEAREDWYPWFLSRGWTMKDTRMHLIG